MESRFNNSSILSETEDFENSPENSGDSLPSGTFNEGKIASTSFPKRSRRAMEKRVVSVPIKDMDGSRLKGEMGAPPSDSWAWRKYGQKPIKGSPYPRAYYRCSSSKGCPARKQVERSRLDPNMLVITYACEHNHPWPTSRNNHHHNLNHKHNSNDTNTATDTVSTDSEPNKAPAATILTQPEPEMPDHQRFENLCHEESLITPDHGFRSWFSDFECSSPTLLETPIFVEDRVSEADTTHFSMREEDELLFADLGELPECSTVFGRGVMEREEERRQCTFTPWCGTT